MTDITSIANAALSHCGTRSKITSLDEGSSEANACLTHIALVRDATLRLFDWNFARMTAGLAQLPHPTARWAYKYALPSDCLRLRRLNDRPLGEPATFCELAADRDDSGAPIAVVLTDLAPATAIYTARLTDASRWDAGFVDAVTWGLASRICFELTGRDERARTLTQMWQGSLMQAAAGSANENALSALPRLPELLQVRR